ncbi:MAG: type I-B CRISPR-associated protein Cas8b1/Cst1 [Candidatus Methanofastidiosia archaeon]
MFQIKSQRNFTGFYSGGYKNPRNAIFHIINIIQSYEERWEDENPSITFYHFINHNQVADLKVYYFPTKVFRFLSHIRTHEKYGEWLKVVRQGYRYVKWDKVKSEDDYKNKLNEVYNRLLQGVSILRYFIEYQERKVYGDWDLLKNYLKEVRGMDEKRLIVLKKVEDEIARYIKETDKIKRLNQLEMSRNYYTFRNVLRLITKDRIVKGERKPLFTLDDYVECLFPEGNLSWRETQDLLLFRIYEILHDWLIEEKKIDLDLEEIESEVS